MASGNRVKIFVIGLDGATFRLIKPWASEGLLLTFRHLLAEGAHGALKSTIPPLTPPSWTSIATGKNPGKHGIFSFGTSAGRSYGRRVVNSADVKTYRIWNILNYYGKKTGILHMVPTYPPEKIDGFMVSSGVLTPQGVEDYTYPEALYNELRRAIPGFSLHIDKEKKEEGKLEPFYRSCLAILDGEIEETLYLMDRYPWDFFWLMHHTIDRVMHYFWRYMDRSHPRYPGPNRYEDHILKIYQKVDGGIGRILNKLDRDTVLIIVSDHGSGPIHKYVFVNTWLHKQGYLQFAEMDRGQTSLLLWRLGLTRRRVIRLKNTLHLGWLAECLPYAAKRLFPKGHPGRSMRRKIDWSQTKAFLHTQSGRGVRINLRGREARGIVEPGGEYEQLRATLMDEMVKILDPETGRPMIKAAHPREEIYSGDFVGEAPDILLEEAEGYWLRPAGADIVKPAGEWPADRTGEHRPDGIFLIYGDQIKRGIEVSGANVFDIAPTILCLMGLPVQRDMDGRVLVQAIDETFLAKTPIRFDQAFESRREQQFELSPEAAEAIEKRLKDLGYL